MDYNAIINRIKSLANPEAVKGMARFGINPDNTYGVSVPNLRKIAKEIGKNHELAMRLWESGIHEARLIASMVGEPKKVSEEQMEEWVGEFDSWDICDQCCSNLFDKTGLGYRKAIEWSQRDEEFVRRAGFVMIATLAVHDKKAADEEFIRFLPIIKEGSSDNRNFVKKAVNWALRQIGKRNPNLNRLAIETASDIQAMNSTSARWIASNAIRELTSEAIQQRLSKLK